MGQLSTVRKWLDGGIATVDDGDEVCVHLCVHVRCVSVCVLPLPWWCNYIAMHSQRLTVTNCELNDVSCTVLRLL